MKWNESFALGIAVIDEQHKRIFEHLLAIENAVAKRDPWHILHFLLDELETYMRFHLAVEEAVLQILRYPGAASHRTAHENIVARIAELENGLKNNPAADKLVSFFESWFLRHVLADDREYAAYIGTEYRELLDVKTA